MTMMTMNFAVLCSCMNVSDAQPTRVAIVFFRRFTRVGFATLLIRTGFPVWSVQFSTYFMLAIYRIIL